MSTSPRGIVPSLFIVLLVSAGACAEPGSSTPSGDASTSSTPWLRAPEADPIPVPLSRRLRVAAANVLVSRAHGAFAFSSPASGLDARAAHPTRDMVVTASTEGVALRARDGGRGVRLRLAAKGRGEALEPVAPADPAVDGNRLIFERSGIIEEYIHGPLGLEQRFSLDSAPPGDGDLTLRVEVDALAVTLEGCSRTAWLVSQDGLRVRYADLFVHDAEGNEVEARLETASGALLIRVDDRGARYPITIDPLLSVETKLTAPDTVSWDRFGYAVALDGDTAVIGTPFDVVAGDASGSAYVFVRSGGVWTQEAKLVPSDAASWDLFGSSVAVQGDRVVVGAVRDDAAGGRTAGAVYVFARSGGVWTQEQKLVSADLGPDDRFGWAVALDGDRLLVGAPYHQVGMDVSGAAYVFERSGGAWSQVTRLTASAAGAGDEYGWTVALGGTTAVVGAPHDPDGVATGAVYIHTGAGATWTEQAVLRAGDSAPDDRFGASLALDGVQLLVGAPRHDALGSAAGAAYRFVRSGATWSEDVKLLATDGEPADYFGFSVALEGDTAVVGAYGDDDLGGTAGAAYVFVLGLEWAQRSKIRAADGVAADRFAFSVDLSGADVISGAYGDDDHGETSGSAYLDALSRTGSADGAACSADAGCFSGFCVDAVCCTTECGGGATDDCRVCSTAAGASVDGLCAPLPAAMAATVVCRPPVGPCDAAETCDSAMLECPPDLPAVAGSVCRPSAGGCDAAETCDGRALTCPADGIAARGTPCRPRAGFCDRAEICDGASAVCPADAFQPDGTLCRDALACNGDERCSSGACVGDAPDCDDGEACTADACAEPLGCRHTPIAGCCYADDECDDHNPCTMDRCDGPPAGACMHDPVAGCCVSDEACGDGDPCTEDGCVDNACVNDGIAGCDLDAGPPDPDAGSEDVDGGTAADGGPPPDGGFAPDAGSTADGGSTLDAGAAVPDDGGCGCAAPGRARDAAPWLVALILPLLLLLRTRRPRGLTAGTVRRLAFGLLLLCIGGASGCGGGDDAPISDAGRGDGSMDAGTPDAGVTDGGGPVDGSADAGGDADTSDGGMVDAGPDGGADGGADAGPAGVDAGPRLACNTCHGDATDISPPRDLSGATDTSSRGVGAHRSHLYSGADWHRRVTCFDCHMMPGRPEDPGHMDTPLPAELTWSSLATADGAAPSFDGATCSNVYCHGPTLLPGGTITEPRWTVVDGTEGACGTCHGLPPDPPHIQIDSCGACHNNIAADGTFIYPGRHINGVVDVEITGLDCTSCHGSASGPAPPRDLMGRTATAERGVGAHQSHLGPSAWHREVACGDCHIVPDYVADVGHFDTPGPAELTWSWLPTSDGASPSFDGTTCAGVYCHGVTLPGGSLTTPEWTRVDGTQAACGTCHGGPPPPPHPAFSDCGLCHPTTNRDGSAFIAPDLHINGVLDVRTMDCESCHGGGGVFAPPSDTSGGVSTSLRGVGAHRSHLGPSSWHAEITCDACHVVPASFADVDHMDSPLPAELTFGSMATAGGAIPSWDGVRCSGVYCHGATLTEAGPLTNPEWTVVDGSQAACGTCHLSHLGHGTAECWDCHPFTIAPGGGFGDPSHHINGIVEALDCLDCHFR